MGSGKPTYSMDYFALLAEHEMWVNLILLLWMGWRIMSNIWREVKSINSISVPHRSTKGELSLLKTTLVIIPICEILRDF